MNVCFWGEGVIWLKPMEKPSIFTTLRKFLGFPVAQWSRICRFDPWVGKIPLEKEMATHSSILAWEIPQTEESGGLQSMAGSQKSWTWLRDQITTKNPNNSKGLGSNETKAAWFSGARGGYPARWPTLSYRFSVPRVPDPQAFNPRCPDISSFLQLWVRRQDAAHQALAQTPQ